MKKLVVALLVGTIWFGSGMQADAAGLRDVFDAEYYADQYEDLEKAFGNDAEALYQHFLNYGLKEGRNMSPILDVAKYRKQYKDLDKAFGDNWDAYVDHFFNYGINENRDNGTAFDVKKYVSSYEDLSKAFGKDYKKAAKHYLEHGKKESRDKGYKDEKIKSDKKPHQTPEVSAPSQGTTETTMLDNGGWYVSEYDADGFMTKRTFYYENGDMERYFICRYDENRQLVREDYYDAQGVLTTYSQIEYFNDGTLVVTTMYNSDGTIAVNSFDNVGRTHDLICYYADGSFASWCQWNVDENGEYYDYREFNEDGSLLQEYELGVDEDGNPVFVPEEVEDIRFTGSQESVNSDGSKVIMEYVDGLLVKSTIYKADGTLDYWTAITYDELDRETGSTTYDAAGNVLVSSESVLDADGNVIERKSVDWTGLVTINKYDRVNGYHTVLGYNADGSFLSHEVYKMNEYFEYVEGKSYDADGNVISEYDMVKDADGNYTIVPKEA